MSDAKRLLAEATPLPWSRSGPGPEPDGDQVWLVGNGNQAQFIAWTDASLGAMADFDLAAYAVNRLPDYEAAVEALERLAHYTDAAAECSFSHECDHRQWLREETDRARTTLARLRKSVPA